MLESRFRWLRPRRSVGQATLRVLIRAGSLIIIISGGQIASADPLHADDLLHHQQLQCGDFSPAMADIVFIKDDLHDVADHARKKTCRWCTGQGFWRWDDDVCAVRIHQAGVQRFIKSACGNNHTRAQVPRRESSARFSTTRRQAKLSTSRDSLNLNQLRRLRPRVVHRSLAISSGTCRTDIQEELQTSSSFDAVVYEQGRVQCMHASDQPIPSLTH